MSKIEYNYEAVDLTTEEIEKLVKDYQEQQKQFENAWHDSAVPVTEKLSKMINRIQTDKEADFKAYTPIFDTEFSWLVPYHVDAKKWQETLKDFIKQVPGESVYLSGTVEMVDGDLFCRLRVIGSQESDYYFYKEFSTLTDDEPYEEFKKSALLVVSCLTSVDKEAVMQMVEGNNKEINKLQAINDILLKIANN